MKAEKLAWNASQDVIKHGRSHSLGTARKYLQQDGVRILGSGLWGAREGGRGRKSAGVAPTRSAKQPPWGRRKAPACGQGCAGVDTGTAPPPLCSQLHWQRPDSASRCPEGGKRCHRRGPLGQRAENVSSKAKVTGLH